MKVLIVDGDDRWRESLRGRVEDEVCPVLTVSSARDARSVLEHVDVDLVVCGPDVPDGEGADFAVRAAEADGARVLLVLDELDDELPLHPRVSDFQLNPSQAELMLRIKRLVRGSADVASLAPAGVATDEAVWRLGCVRFDARRRRCHVGCDGEQRHLTLGETLVLATLIERERRVVSRDELSLIVSGREWSPESRGVDAIVSRLRRKLRCRSGCNEGAIGTIRGRGYRLVSAGH